MPSEEPEATEETPLLDTPPPTPFWKSLSKRFWLTFAVSFLGLTVLITALVLYLIILPERIQQGLDGNQSHVTLIQLHRIEWDQIDLSISLDIPVDDTPLPLFMRPNPMTMTSNDVSYFETNATLAVFDLPRIDVPAHAQHVPITYRTTFRSLNIPWIYWFLSRTAKHGFNNSTFKLVAHPIIDIPYVGAFSGLLTRTFVLSPIGDFDPNIFNASYTDVKLETEETEQGTRYLVELEGHFTNPWPIVIDPMGVEVSFDIEYQGVTILAITLENVSLDLYHNTIHIKVASHPRYTAELMDWVGKYSEGELTHISLFNARFNLAHVPWIVDMVQSWRLPLAIPGATDDFSFH